MRIIGWLALWVLTLVSFAPILSIIAAGATASLLDCRLDEGAVHPCLLGTLDLGEAVYTGDVLGWFMFITWPGMLVSLAIWVGLLIRWLVRRWRA